MKNVDYNDEQVDPYAELEAANTPGSGKQIRLLNTMGEGKHSDWEDAGYDWHWIFLPEDYEIRTKPAKVKLLAWFDGETIFWRVENTHRYPGWLRVPTEDKEIEVEE